MRFPLSSILSVTTDRMLTEDIGDLYKILNFMTGCSLFTHQLARAAMCAKPSILRQHPDLKDINPDIITPVNWREKLLWLERRFGEFREVEALGRDEYIHFDPIDELNLMGVPDSKIILIRID